MESDSTEHYRIDGGGRIITAETREQRKDARACLCVFVCVWPSLVSVPADGGAAKVWNYMIELPGPLRSMPRFWTKSNDPLL